MDEQQLAELKLQPGYVWLWRWPMVIQDDNCSNEGRSPNPVWQGAEECQEGFLEKVVSKLTLRE